MTYCLAIKIEEGLVFCSDSRTNAGADRISAFSKLHRFPVGRDRQLALLSSGNLATTQAVVDAISRDIRESADSRNGGGRVDSQDIDGKANSPDVGGKANSRDVGGGANSPDVGGSPEFTVANATYLADVADYIGQLSRTIQNKYAPAGEEAGFNARASFILGGQIRGEEPELYLIYPEGNHIRTSNQHPFFQIGETKYGKPILDRIIDADTPHELAMRCALVSMDSTMRSNVTVGPPIELLFIGRDRFGDKNKYRSFAENDSYLSSLRESWNEELVQAFNKLPSLNPIFDSN